MVALVSSIYPAHVYKRLHDLAVNENIAQAYVLVNDNNNQMKCLGRAFSFKSYSSVFNFLELPLINIGETSFELPHMAVFADSNGYQPFIWSFRLNKFVSTEGSNLFIPISSILPDKEILDECKIEF